MAFKTTRARLPAVGRSMKPTRVSKPGNAQAKPSNLPAPQQPKPKAPADTITLFIRDIVSSLERITTQPAVMMTGIVSVVLILSHLSSKDDSILDGWIKYVTTSQPKLGEWLIERENWLYGLVAFLPAVLSVPESKRAVVAVACVAWVFVLPHRHPWEYLVQAVAVRVFFTTGRASTRTMLVGLVALLYWLGLMTFSD